MRAHQLREGSEDVVCPHGRRMGHNDMDYGTRPSKELSSTFANEVQRFG